MSVAVVSPKQLLKEVQLWKERYFVERKCRRLIENWAHYAFGFDVKTEYDKTSNEIKIQGFENREAIKTAAIPNESVESGIRAVIMEGKMSPEDFVEDQDDLMVVEDTGAASSGEGESSLQQTQTCTEVPVTAQLVASGSGSTNTLISSAGAGGMVITGQQQFQQIPFEVSSGSGENNPQEIYYIGGNYDDNNVGGGQPQYFILKSNDNEDIPIQIDYSSIFGGSGSTNAELNDKQMFYRILGTADTSSGSCAAVPVSQEAVSLNANPTITNSSHGKSSAVKRKFSPPKSTESKPVPPKSKKNSSSKPNHSDRNTAEVENTPNSKSAKSTGASETKVKPNLSVLKTSEEKNPIEFGLTLREKAEIYVRTKASEVLRKVGSGYECTLCPEVQYIYNSYENALTHTKSHFDSKPYKCEYCSETFAVQREVLQHRKVAHPKTKNSNTSTSFSNLSSSSTKATAVPLHSAGQVLGLPSSQGKSLVVSNSNSKQVTVKPTNAKNYTIVNPKPKSFKCQVEGCEWAYATSEELGWHMKAHQQNRI